jgi:hypothetical protein
MICRGMQINPYNFPEATLIEALHKDEGEDFSDTIVAELPQKFTAEMWIQWDWLTSYGQIWSQEKQAQLMTLPGKKSMLHP